MKKFDCFLDSGVCVEVPDDVDPDTPEGYQELKSIVRLRLINLLTTEGFDIDFQEYEEIN